MKWRSASAGVINTPMPRSSQMSIKTGANAPRRKRHVYGKGGGRDDPARRLKHVIGVVLRTPQESGAAPQEPVSRLS
jgi:hypothetical protein